MGTERQLTNMTSDTTKNIELSNIIPQLLAVAFVILIIFYPSTKNQSASILQVESQSSIELWEPVQSVPDDIYFYYPLAVGNSWEYKGQEKMRDGSGSDGKEIINTYNHTVTIKNIKKNKENIFEIEEEVCNDKNNLHNSGECNINKFYLVGKNICYSSDCYEIELSFPLPENQVLLGQYYKERMEAGIDDKMYVNYVYKKQSSLVLGKERNNCFPIEYVTLPDESIEIFCYNIGYISYSYKHHGSLDDIEDKLVKINF